MLFKFGSDGNAPVWGGSYGTEVSLTTKKHLALPEATEVIRPCP